MCVEKCRKIFERYFRKISETNTFLIVMYLDLPHHSLLYQWKTSRICAASLQRTTEYLSFNTLGFCLAPNSQNALKHVSLFSIIFFPSMASILAPFGRGGALVPRFERTAMGGAGLTRLRHTNEKRRKQKGDYI